MRIPPLSSLTVSPADDCAPLDGHVRAIRDDETRAISALMSGFAHRATGLEIVTALVWERRRQGMGGFIVLSSPPAHASRGDGLRCIELLWVASYLPRFHIERELVDAAANWRGTNSEHVLAVAEREISWTVRYPEPPFPALGAVTPAGYR